MTRLLLFLLLGSGTLFAQSPESSAPLNEGEQRLVLSQLYELKACRAETATLNDYIAREAEQDTREKQNAARALELEKQATALAQKERDLAQEKAAMFEQLYRSVTKKPGIGCRIFRAITLGIGRCE